MQRPTPSCHGSGCCPEAAGRAMQRSRHREPSPAALGIPYRREPGGGRRGSNIVRSLPVPTLRRAIRRPKFAQAQAFVLHNPRSTGQEGSNIVSSLHSLPKLQRFGWSRHLFLVRSLDDLEGPTPTPWRAAVPEHTDSRLMLHGSRHASVVVGAHTGAATAENLERRYGRRARTHQTQPAPRATARATKIAASDQCSGQ